MDVRAISRTVVAAALVVATGREGTADAQQPSLRVDYQAPAGCPDADSFTAEVRARAPGPSTLAGRTIELKIGSPASGASDAAKFEGRVVIADAMGVTSSRAVRGDTCAEVVRALALAVAMTVDPAEEAPAVPPVSIDAPAPTSAVAAPIDRDAPRTDDRESVHVTAGLRAGVETAIGPLLAPALGIYGELETRHASLRLGAVRAVSPLVERAAGSARFARTTVAVDGCPLRWHPAASVALVPCATVEVGSLGFEGEAVVSPESSARWWVAAGLSGRVVWEPFAPVVLELEGRATVPFTRDTFYFRPADDVFQAPIVAFAAGLTAGVRFR